MALQAKKAKELEKEKYTHPLTTDELKALEKLEAFIDEQIVKSTNCTDVHIDYTHLTSVFRKFQNQRFDILKKEIERRYRESGWKITLKLDDGLDGPNMSGPDNWILTTK